MFKSLVSAAAVLSLLGGTAMAAQCRDSTGKFVKCATTAPQASVVKDASGKCHVASGPKKGQFAPCP
jgi:hypothetical protein